MKYKTELIGLAVVIAIAGAVHYFLNIRGTSKEPEQPTAPKTPDVPKPAVYVTEPKTGGPQPVKPVQRRSQKKEEPTSPDTTGESKRSREPGSDSFTFK